MSNIMDKLKKNSRIKETTVLSDSQLYKSKDVSKTNLPILNIALGGNIDAGVISGSTIIAGPSKHFKSLLGLVMVKAYLEKHSDAALLFYDTEFGMPEAYFEMLGIDRDRVMHVPVMDIEELKFDIINQLENLERKDKIIIMIDSLGNIASKKEMEDAKNAKSVADMSRAKALKSCFRMITPYLTKKDIPLIGINHTYQEQGLFPKAVVSGGTGIYYSADTIFIMGRRQEKTGTEVTGYDFIINVEKSRFVKEKSKLPVNVRWDGGISKWSGMMDIAVAGGYVKKPKLGWYSAHNPETGEALYEKNFRIKEIENNDEFWEKIFSSTNFAEWIKAKYTVGYRSLMNDAEEEEEEYNEQAEV